MKRAWLAIICGLTACAVAQAQPMPSPELSAVLRAAHAGAARQRADKFAEVASPGVAGTPFRVQLRLRDGDSTGVAPNTGFWTYKERRLTFHFSPEDVGPLGSRTKVFFIAGRMTPGRPYVASNAFGTSVRVSVENWSQDAIAIVKMPVGEVSPFYQGDDPYRARLGLPAIQMPEDNFPYSVEASGPEARGLVTNVRLVIEGKFAPLFGKGSLTDCDIHHIAPDIDGPIEIILNACWVGAEISRIAYVNTATGAVLKEFVRKPPPIQEAKPSDEAILRLYPERALRMNVAGSANLHCAVADDGRLADCSVISETPPDHGFGDAAIRVSRLYRMDPAKSATIDIPISFKLP